jgi:serine/threonine protein kinase
MDRQCKCKYKTGPNAGERCKSKANIGSEFCGRHSKCTDIIPITEVAAAIECATTFQERPATRAITRENRYRNIYKALSGLPDKLCIADIPEVLTPGRVLGCGSFGEVIIANLTGKPELGVAIKMTKTKNTTRTKTSLEWDEINLLEQISKLLTDGVTPHVPMLYRAVGCDTCSISDTKLSKGARHVKCILTMVELCDGTLDKVFETRRSYDFCRNILFQILASLHAVQKHLHLFHNDLKMANLLFLRTKDTGATCYTIRGHRYYLPNCGYTVVLNDFGVSQTITGRSKLEGRKLTEVDGRLVLHNDIINLAEVKAGREKVNVFSCDIIDSLTMFLGLPRASQHGMHPVIPGLPVDFTRGLLELLRPVGIKADSRITSSQKGHYYINMKIPGVRYETPLDPALTKFVDAGLFIEQTFQEFKTPIRPVVAKYNI